VENEKHLTRKSKLEIEKNSLHEDVEKLDNNIAAIEDKFHVDGEFDYEMDELESALKDLTRERDSIKDEIDKLELEKKKKSWIIWKIKKKKTHHVGDISEMENKIEEKEKEIENEKNLLDTGDDDEKVSKLNQKKSKYENDRNKLIEEIEDLENNHSNLKNQYQSLVEEYEDTQKKNQGQNL